MVLVANGRRARFTRDVGGIEMDLGTIEQVDVAALGGSDTLTVDDQARTAVRTSTPTSARRRASADHVIVNGTDGDDAITAAGGAGSATVTGLRGHVNVTGAEPRDDALTINAPRRRRHASRPTALAANAIALTQDGGAGNDTLLGGSGADR